MARYSIKRPGGGVLYEGCPTYVGQYMKPGTLTYRNVASPEPIDFAILDYTDYEKVRWGMSGIVTRFLLLTLPPVKKLARRDTNGNSFVYDQVVLYDATKLFDFIPFRDIVPEDNSIHFSSKESFSVYDNVPAIAERIQACLDAVYPGAFNIMVATSNMGAPQTLLDLMNEDREISFTTGGTVMDALQKIYEVWPEVGWVSFQLNISKTTVVIGGAGLIGGTHTFRYGEGLTDIANNVANDNEIANIIYPFGNSKNLLPRYYNSLPIHNAESADIQHLMIPTSYWGQTDGEPDPLKAGVMDNASILKIGPRPKIVYFNGQNDLEDIFPTIKGLTTTDLLDYIDDGGTVDFPPASTDTDLPLDSVVAVVRNPKDTSANFDDGFVGESGKASIAKTTNSISGSGTGSFSAGDGEVDPLVDFAQTCQIFQFPSTTQKPLVRVKLTNVNVTVNTATQALRESIVVNAYLRCLVYYYEVQGGINRGVYKSVEIPLSGNGRQRSLQNDVEFVVAPPAIAQIGVNTDFYVSFDVIVEYTNAAGSGTFSCAGSFDAEASVEKDLEPNFQICINPFGYDLTDIVTTDGSVRIAMTSGACAGREFVVKNCMVESDGTVENSLFLTLRRQFDESLSQYFPNSSYPVAVDDTFVILGIAMPEFYINAASNRLYTAAQEYLAQHKSPMWQYTPSIDAKYMVENSLTIVPAQNFVIVDPEMIPDGVDARSFFIDSNGLYFLTSDGEKILLAGSGFSLSILVDSVTINEGESNIPTWKVSLRDRKKKRS